METNLEARNATNAVPAQQIILDGYLDYARVSSVTTTGSLKYQKNTNVAKYIIYEDTTVTSTSARSVSGTATVRFNNCGQDSNGNRIDAIVTLSNVTVKLGSGTAFKQPSYMTICTWGVEAQASSLTIQDGLQGDKNTDFQLGNQVSVTSTIRTQFVKTGTSTVVSNTFISGVTDIDAAYSGNRHPESLKLYSGVNSAVYVLPASQRDSHFVISESNTKFSAIVGGGDDSTYKTGLVYIANGDHTLQWTGNDCGTVILQTYFPSTITATAGTGGTITNAGAKKIGWKNTPTYTSTANKYYKISSVKIDGTAVSVPANSKTYSYTFPAVYADHKIDATFERIKTPLKYDKNLTAATGTTSGVTVDAGTNTPVAQNGFSASGYTFKGWNTKPDGTGVAYQPGSQIFIEETAVTLYAQWEPIRHTVSETHTEGGTVTPSGSDTDVEHGSSYEWTIEAEPGYRISSVTLNGAPIEITDPYSMKYLLSAVDSDNEIHVEFEQLPAMVVYDANAPEGEIATGEMQKVKGDAETPHTILESGYRINGWTFVGWSTSALPDDDSDDSLMLSGDEIAFPAAGECTILYAQWKKNPKLTIILEGHGTVHVSQATPEGIDLDIGEIGNDAQDSWSFDWKSDASIKWNAADMWYVDSVEVNGVLVNKDTYEFLNSQWNIDDMQEDHVVKITMIPMVDMPETGRAGTLIMSAIGIMSILLGMIRGVKSVR